MSSGYDSKFHCCHPLCDLSFLIRRTLPIIVYVVSFPFLALFPLHSPSSVAFLLSTVNLSHSFRLVVLLVVRWIALWCKPAYNDNRLIRLSGWIFWYQSDGYQRVGGKYYINQSTNQSINQSIDQSIDQSINHPIKQSIQQLSNPAINQCTLFRNISSIYLKKL